MIFGGWQRLADRGLKPGGGWPDPSTVNLGDRETGLPGRFRVRGQQS